MNGIWILLVAALLYSCGNRDVAGGSTVETDNAISVQVFLSDGKPASKAIARIRPAWSVADTATKQIASLYARDLQADSLGQIRCEDLAIGTYALEVQSAGVGAFIQFEHRDTISREILNDVSLKLLGSIEGQVELPMGTQYAWIQVYGLDRVVKTDSSGNFSLDSLPPSALHIRAITGKQVSVIADDLVQVHSGYSWNVGTLSAASIYTEDPLTWRYSQSIEVDSLFSDWMLPLSNPTVGFLRLDSTNFDFSQAMDDGRDLRFFDEFGNRLVYERASWNANLKTAFIRIRIAGLSLSSQIEMRWGCDGAVDPGDAGLWEGVADSVVEELYTVLVGDFEDGSLQSNLQAPIAPHFWYLIPQDTNVNMSPSSDSALLALQLAGSGRSGTAFHITSTGPSYKWALLGLNLYKENARNFDHLDSVVFWVRGTGYYEFAFENLLDSNGGKAVFSDSLDTVWTRKCVRPENFMPADSISGNYGWEAIQYSVTNMSFFAFGDVDFWLDDIRIYGLNRDDLE
ncbi:MAG: hypothetical protein AUK31_09365 [Fibrobacteres bacterium CG2_30_45_31]|nr:MAG: hypothetical protein AUK31_09365 [Fibrobacteres bacterium CG2_30_45_31]